MGRFILLEQETVLSKKNIKNKEVNFLYSGGAESFTIKAYVDNNQIGYINLLRKMLPEPTYTVKYVEVSDEYKKSQGDTDSVAKNLYDLAKLKAKELGGEYLGSDSRLSADSHRNWFARREKDPNTVSVVDDPRAKSGKKYTDSPLEKNPKQRYRVRLEIKNRKKKKDV